MSLGNSEKIISILSGRGFEVNPHPGRDNIDRPGYYFNDDTLQIEHWSEECEYNRVMGLHHYNNENGLIQDGFQSVLPFTDAEELVQSIEVWDKHLVKYGVK